MLDKNKVEKFIKAAEKYKKDKYSIPRRMEKGYSDCSSLVYKALRDSELLDSSQTTRTVSTMYMRGGDPRFEPISMFQLQRGDLLWWQKERSGQYSGHVAIYLGDDKVLEAIYEGVVIKSRYRINYQRAYRIKSLKKDPTTPTKKRVFSNIPITINGHQIKTKCYVVDGISYLISNNQNRDIHLREHFESIGGTVHWRDFEVWIDL